MTRRRIRRWIIVVLVVAAAILLGYERLVLLVKYQHLRSDEFLSEGLALVPRTRSVSPVEAEAMPVTLGFAEFRSCFGEVVGVSLEMFPKVRLEFPECSLLFVPPFAYGQEWRDWHVEQRKIQPERYARSERENRYLMRSYLDPYGFSKEVYYTEPKPLWKLAFFPKRQLREYFYRMRQKAGTIREYLFLEDEANKAVLYSAADSGAHYSHLKIYDPQKQWVQHVIITCKGDTDPAAIAECLVATFRFTVHVLPNTDEKLRALVEEAIDAQ